MLVVARPDITLGPVLISAGAVVLALVFVQILRTHFAGYTLVMALGVLAWLAGSLLWLLGVPVFHVVLWWVGFLVLTIAGERLELGRLVRLTRRSRLLFSLAAALYLIGALLALWDFDLGVRMAGAGMLGLAAWLLRYDIARRTVRKPGLPRYIAVCLLSGYVWLGVSGLIGLLAGVGELREFAPAGPLYDALLHGVLVGFVFGMIFGHAPIIFPAVLGLPVTYHPILYTPLVLLNLSLVLRLAGDLGAGHGLRQWGGLLKCPGDPVLPGAIGRVAPARQPGLINRKTCTDDTANINPCPNLFEVTMIDVHLYGNLRRRELTEIAAPDSRPNGNSVIQYEAQPGETIEHVLAGLGIASDQISTLFYNARLLVTRNSMAPWLGYVQVRPDPHSWDLGLPVQPGDRLGVFGNDMPALVV